MKNRFCSAIFCILLICFLAACNDNVIDHPISNETTSTSTIINSSEHSVPDTDTSSAALSGPDISDSLTDATMSAPDTSVPPQTSSTPDTTTPPVTTPPVSEPPVAEPPITESSVAEPPITEPPSTEPPKTDPPITEPPHPEPPVTEPPITEPPSPPETIHATSVQISLSSYASSNEPTPYVKGQPIYLVLYNGERAQVGDTLTFTLNINPANHTDTVVVSVTDNLSYELSGNTLKVKVNSISDLGSGRITVYVQDPANGAISATVRTTFAIDKSGNPFDNLSGVFSSYIRSLGMSYTTVTQGYTYSDPSLSFTSFAGAPAWDDQILKSEADWLARCFWLLDKYREAGFTKVNFIETNTSLGFSASK